MNPLEHEMVRVFVTSRLGIEAAEYLGRLLEAVADDRSNEISALRKALSFYADPSRYRGENLRLESPDEWSERKRSYPYRLNVTRDYGEIARTVLDDYRILLP